MLSPEPIINFQHTEERRGVVENPKISTLLGSAGLTAVDFQLFDKLFQQGQSVFVHGSVIANRITPESDIDFTIIGETAAISPELRESLMPGFNTTKQLHAVDYTSTSVRSQAGRTISMHMSAPNFRETFPVVNKPYATEYRPGIHAKAIPRKYFLSGADRNGNIRLINFLCKSETVGNDGSTVTDVPQTGIFILKGQTVFVNGKEKTNMTAGQVIRLRSNGEPDSTPSDDAEETMILGLEFDKMLSDTSMYHNPAAEQRFVRSPITSSMEALGVFTKTDPAVITNRLFGELSRYWSQVKPNKLR